MLLEGRVHSSGRWLLRVRRLGIRSTKRRCLTRGSRIMREAHRQRRCRHRGIARPSRGRIIIPPVYLGRGWRDIIYTHLLWSYPTLFRHPRATSRSLPPPLVPPQLPMVLPTLVPQPFQPSKDPAPSPAPPPAPSRTFSRKKGLSSDYRDR